MRIPAGVLRTSLPIVVLAGGLAGRALLSPGPALPLEKPLAAFPAEVAGKYRTVADQSLAPAVLDVLRPDDYLLRDYRRPSGEGFDLFVAYYGRQVGGGTIHSPRNCLPGSGWEPVEHSPAHVASVYGPSTVNRYVVEHRSGVRAVVYYWYQGRGRVQASEYRVKWDLARDAVLGRRTEEALVRLVFPVRSGGEADAGEQLRIVRETIAMLDEHLPRREGRPRAQRG